MPLYEFACANCGTFECRLNFDEARIDRECAECRAPAQRVFSSIQFKRPMGASDVARATDRERRKRARSGEPRIEHRAIAAAPEKPMWQPLHGAHGPGK